LSSIPDRLAELERRLGPSDRRAQEIEAVSRRLIAAVDRMGFD
jgi:hypothetical protein